MNAVYVVSAKRTAIGSFGGSLKDSEPAALGAAVTRDAIEAAGLERRSIGQAFFGQVIATSPSDYYLARVVALEAGLAEDTPSLTVNRLCGSGLQAIVSAAQALMLDDTAIAIAGGAEVMSRAPFLSLDTRWGRKMGDAKLIDGLNGALTDPFHSYLMGVTAENVAARYQINRAQQDAYALESQRRAIRAIKEDRFNGQITTVEVKVRRGTVQFALDEFPRADASADALAKLRPIFTADGLGTVTAGNASGVNDGAAALVLATERAVNDHQLKPMARLVAYAHAGVDPAYMGIGPIPAVRNVLERARLTIDDMSVVEANDAFAAQACAIAQELNLNPENTNPNGSGISLGHPVGATGAIITTKLVHELQRIQGRYGLATMCIGGGQGIAAIFERT